MTVNISGHQSEIIRRYADGETGTALAEEFRCSSATIYRLIREQGSDEARARLKNYHNCAKYIPTQEEIAKAKIEIRKTWATKKPHDVRHYATE